jgi:tetratricopeptide (TPR) repeat protein
MIRLLPFSILFFALGLNLVAPEPAGARRGGPERPKDFRVEFQPNQPQSQYNYFKPGKDGRMYLRNVERAHLHPGIKCLKEKNYWCAHQNLDFVLRWFPNHPRGLDFYSQLAVNRGRPDSAIPYLDYALRFDPGTPSSLIVYGLHRFRTGEFEKAAKRFQQALSNDPDSAEAHYHLGLTLVELKRWEKALKHAQLAYDLGYPLPGLKEKLRRHGKWHSASEASTP